MKTYSRMLAHASPNRSPRRQTDRRRLGAAVIDALESRRLMTAAFAAATHHSVNAAPDFVTSADVNLDGKMDLIASTYAGSGLRILLGNGNGTFAAAGSVPLVNTPDFVTATDLNNDGKPDLLTADFDTGTVTVLIGNGNGTFQTGVSYGARGARAVQVADLNGDGKLDLAVAKSFEKRLSVLFGNGNGTFQEAVHTTLSVTPNDLVTGDVDGDGDIDLVVSDFFTDKVTLLRNNGSGAFTAGSSFTVGAGPTAIAAGDFNADGKLDIATANYFGNNVSVLIGNGAGSFAAAVNYASGGGASHVLAVDLDADGRLDLAVANANANNVAVLGGNANGTFQSAITFAVGTSPRSLVATDLDGNGSKDLATANQGGTTLSVLLSQVTTSAPPVADAGGPYSAPEGGSVSLSGAASTGAGLTYAWDLDGDGVFGETGAGATRGNETGVAPSFSAVGLDGPSSRTVSLRVTDGQGRTSTDTATVNITNVAPTLSISGAATVFVGSPYALTLSSSDPGSDTISSWTINWGDGNTQVVSGNPSSVTHTYSSAGTFVISATATDEDGTYSSNTRSVTASLDVPPAANAGGPYTVAEGGSVVLTGAGSAGVGLTYAWDLDGDGIFGESGAAATRGVETGVSPTFSAAGLDGPSSRTVSLRVTDSQNRTSTATATINITNVAPTLSIGGANSVNEGSTYTLTLSSSDPGTDTITSWTIQWGDGTTQVVAGNPSSVTKVYADNGSYTITATATDEDGTYSSNSKSLTVANVAPTLTISGANSTSEGSTYTLNLASADPGNDTITRWNINWGDGTTQVVNGNPSSVTKVYADNGSYTITATATDEDGTFASNSRTVSVANVAPTLSISGNNSVNEGSTYTLSLSSVDPGNDTITRWTINWGNGTSQVVNGNPSSVTKVYADNGSYTITATATDEDGTYSANSKAITVINVAPTLTISGAGTSAEGSAYTLALAVSDPGTDTIASWTINWGDGTTQVVAGNPFSVSRIFSDDGSYTVTATAADEDGSYSANSITVQVSNVAPTLAISGSSNAAVGVAWTLELSSADPGDDTIVGWTIDWGDGTVEAIAGDPSSASHTYTAPGDYTVSATATDEDGTFSAGTQAVSVIMLDAEAPTAVAIAPNVTEPASVYRFTVEFSDNVGIDPGSIGSGDVVVTGPGGFSAAATLVSLEQDRAGAATAVFEFAAPDGGWQFIHNGTYTITLSASAVFDVSGNAAAAGDIGTFNVNLLPPDSAGNDMETARYFGIIGLGTIRVAEDYVGPNDRNDFYRIKLDERLKLSIKLTLLFDNLNLKLLDAAGNEIAYSNRGSTSDEILQLDLDPGTYFVRVLLGGELGSTYRLRLEGMAPDPIDLAGNDPSSARNLGAIGAGTVRVAEDVVGPGDRNDYYRFDLSGTRKVSIKLTGLTANADLHLYDANGNRIAVKRRLGANDETIAMKLGPGTYYVRVEFAATTTEWTPYRLRIAA